ncbi:MAG: cell division protein FtsA [Candidatus Saccharimonas sp.]
MHENSRYAIGIDVGTTMVRCVVGHVDPATGMPTIVGVGHAVNSGMRKGTVVNLSGPARAIDEALGEAERMSGYEVNNATISVNGSHILSTHADGMIAVGMADHEVNEEDLVRIEEVATTGKVPSNREILEVVPHSYVLDGQAGIKDPLGMTGTRLEIDANVVSALTPYVANLQKAVEMATVQPRVITPAVLGAAKAVLNERQIESGVAVVDLGGTTTSVAVFEEGDLQYVGVVSVGGVNITNDLAIGLKTDPEIAEEVKLKHAAAGIKATEPTIKVHRDKETYEFSTDDVEEIVEARLEEIFEAVQKELKRAGRAGKLPSGVILTGGTAQLKGIAGFAKQQLGVAARIGRASGFNGVADNIDQPQFATAVGLMLADAENDSAEGSSNKFKKGEKPGVKKAAGIITKLFSIFKA